MADPWETIGGAAHEDIEDTSGLVVFEGTKYTTDEAEKLVGLLNHPDFSLLDRMFAGIRAISEEIMDSGTVSISSAEELVRQSTRCNLIWKIRHMAENINAQLEAIKKENALSDE